MSAGLPVVATRVAGLKDLTVNGQTALWIEKDDAAALADAIARLADDAFLRRRLGEAGRDRMIERFSVQSVIEAHEQLYLELGSMRSGGRA
jgi:glycosyltransferase involved in cell wall biosynthesis